MAFKVEFDTENDALMGCDGDKEVIRILAEISAKVEKNQTGGPIYDVNGNKVGRWSWRGAGSYGLDGP